MVIKDKIPGWLYGSYVIGSNNIHSPPGYQEPYHRRVVHPLRYCQSCHLLPAWILGTIPQGWGRCTPTAISKVKSPLSHRILGTISQVCVHLLGYWEYYHPPPRCILGTIFGGQGGYSPCNIESNTLLFPLYIRNYITGVCTPSAILGLMLSSPPLNVKNISQKGVHPLRYGQ